MFEASAMHGLDPRDGVGQQRCDITSKILSARLVVHLAVGGESRHMIGHIQQARDQVACPWHGKSGPCTDGDQRQGCSDDRQDCALTSISNSAKSLSWAAS
jgi:hypothetical protein